MKAEREHISLQAEQSFGCFEFNLEAFDNPYHFHPEIEITWIVKSEGQRLVGDSLMSFKEGDLVMIGPNVPHQYRSSKKGEAHSFVIQFDPLVFGRDLLQQHDFKCVSNLIVESNRGIAFSPDIKNDACEMIESISFEKRQWARSLKLLELLGVLSSDMSRQPIASVAYSQPVSMQKIERLKKAMVLLQEHASESLTVNDIAEVLFLHPHSVSRFFKQHVGVSFQEYLIQLRVQNAAKLLLETERTVADIAFSCGFRNLSNFNRQFMRIKAMNPSQFKK